MECATKRPIALIAAALLMLLLGQFLIRDRAQRTSSSAASTPPPALRERFEVIQGIVRPDAAPLPVAFEKVHQVTRSGERAGERAREVWVADWRSPGGEGSGFRILLDARTGQVLQVGGEGWTARRVIAAEEAEGAIRTSEEAVRTARHYLRGFGEMAMASAPSAAFTVQHRSKASYPVESWCLMSRSPGGEGRTGIGILLDAKTGALIHYSDLAPKA